MEGGEKKVELVDDEVKQLTQTNAKQSSLGNVIVHPLVMLSVVDHYNRVYNAMKSERVIGVLLGNCSESGDVNVSNCFGLPYEEEGNVWFVDTDYLESMYQMYRKVNAREQLVGWYHTGPNLYEIDISINQTMKEFITDPVLIVIKVKPTDVGSPLSAYTEVEEIKDDGSTTEKTFALRPSKIVSEGAEEIGVEHLLRDVKDRVGRSLAQRVTNRVLGLKGVLNVLTQVTAYLDKVTRGELPMNNLISYHLQEVLNLLPSLDKEYWQNCCVESNNESAVSLFISSVVRSVLGLHDLIENKISLRDAEKGADREISEQETTEKEKSSKATQKAKEADTEGNVPENQ